MSTPQFNGIPRRVSVSALLDALANDLSEIRRLDKLTWGDIGETLGRGEDQAAKYADGTATMDWISYKRGEMSWGSRFTGSVDRLILGNHAAGAPDGHLTLHRLLTAATEIHGLIKDGTLCDENIREARPELEQVRDDIDALLARLGPKAGAA